VFEPLNYELGGESRSIIGQIGAFWHDVPVIIICAGLGGRDVTKEQISRCSSLTSKAAKGEKVKEVNWHNTRGETV